MDDAWPADARVTRFLIAGLVVVLAAVWFRLVWAAQRQGLFRSEERPPQTWNWRAVLESVAAYVGISILVGVVYHLRQGRPAGGTVPEMPPADQMMLMAIINALTMVLVPWIIERTSGLNLADLGLADRRTLERDARSGLLLCLVLLPVVYAVFQGAQLIWVAHEHAAQRALHDQWSADVAFRVVLSAVILAPIAEELLFRGVLLGWLDTLMGGGSRSGLAGGISSWLPNVVVSVLFAAIHWTDWPAPLALFVLSLGLGWLTQRTGRLGGSIAAHMLFNGVSATALILAGPSGGREGMPVPAPEPAARPAAAGEPLPAGFASPVNALPAHWTSTRPTRRIPSSGLTRGLADLGSAWRPSMGASVRLAPGRFQA